MRFSLFQVTADEEDIERKTEIYIYRERETDGDEEFHASVDKPLTLRLSCLSTPEFFGSCLRDVIRQGEGVLGRVGAERWIPGGRSTGSIGQASTVFRSKQIILFVFLVVSSAAVGSYHGTIGPWQSEEEVLRRQLEKEEG